MADQKLQARGLQAGFTVNDLHKSIRFYTDGLGFEITDRNEADGVLRYVMLSAGATAGLGLFQDDFAKGKDRKKGIGMRFWITTSQDLGAISKQVKAAGFLLDSEPAPLPWGPLAFAVTDPDGFHLTIANEGN